MGSPISGMLAQAMPPSDSLAGLSPETIAALKQINGGAGVPQTQAPPAIMNDPSLRPPVQGMMNNAIQGAVDRSNAPVPAPPSQSIGDMLVGYLSNLFSGPKPPAPQPMIFNPADAGQAAIDEQKKREQAQATPAPPAR
jgi:hypothetical protein